MIVKKAIRQSANDMDGDVTPGTPEYNELMHNVEAQVQSVLEEMGEIDY